jgi:hypothetical protein
MINVAMFPCRSGVYIGTLQYIQEINVVGLSSSSKEPNSEENFKSRKHQFTHAFADLDDTWVVGRSTRVCLQTILFFWCKNNGRKVIPITELEVV